MTPRDLEDFLPLWVSHSSPLNFTAVFPQTARLFSRSAPRVPSVLRRHSPTTLFQSLRHSPASLSHPTQLRNFPCSTRQLPSPTFADSAGNLRDLFPSQLGNLRNVQTAGTTSTTAVPASSFRRVTTTTTATTGHPPARSCLRLQSMLRPPARSLPPLPLFRFVISRVALATPAPIPIAIPAFAAQRILRLPTAKVPQDRKTTRHKAQDHKVFSQDPSFDSGRGREL
ncbi:hypothetical protein B0H14DRAFT_2615387 [Mycena olivaceomarginata]|nr:hypothetical protein B0H14DRAFT_2615387 [Mycena olivaceomarginata]